MKIWTWKLALAAMALGALAATPASAQYSYSGYGDPGVSGYYDDSVVAQPAPPNPMNYAEASYDEGAAAAPQGVAGCDGSCGGGCPSCCGMNGSCGDSCCDDSCGGGGCRLFRRRPDLECCDDDPWRLFECLNDNCRGITLTGWVAGGISWNEYNPPSGYNGTVTFNDRHSEIQLNQAYAVLERAVDTEGCGWDIGGRVDLLYGTDSRFTEARGLETDRDLGTKWNTSPFYGLALPQAYAEIAYNDLSVKAGHFYTIIGYEGVMATSGFFYSHSYTHQYGEPFTHTGALASYTGIGGFNLLAGFDRGWDNWEDDNTNRLSGLGGFTWDNGCGTTIALTGTVGQEPTNRGAEPGPVTDDRYLYSFVFSREVNTRITYVLQHDLGFQDRGISDTQDAEWYGINQYLFYKINCCWTGGVRFEWFRDDDGFRVRGIGDRRNGHPLGGTRFRGNFYEVTAGLNWKPTANLTIRPEVRYDWFNGTTNNANVGPFDDGAEDEQFMFAIDAILTY